MKVAFIGLGIMGSRMAHNLLKNGIDLTVANRSPEPLAALSAAGATTADTYAAAVADADVVITMLSRPEAVTAVVTGPEGCLAHMKKGALWMDCSTINPSFSLASHQAAQASGVRYLEAPVAGTLPQAEQGILVFFAGGATVDLEVVRPLMEHMGSKILHIGEMGQGSGFKMLVNLMLAQSMVVFSETVLLGEKMGLSRDFLLNALPGLVVSAPFTKFKAEMIRENEYGVQFPLELMHKDLHLAALTAYEHEQPLYLGNLAKELYADASKQGLGRLDFAAIHQFLAAK